MLMKKIVLLIVTILTTFNVSRAGTITGKVKYTGTIPKPKLLKVDKDKHCIKSSNKIFSEELIVSKKKEIKNVVVSVEGVKGSFEPPNDPVEIGQINCQYTPHITVVTVGTLVDMKSKDPINHNVRTNPEENTPVNYAMPEPMILPLPDFEFPETIRLTCDIHNWMKAYIVVKENPFFDVSNSKGEIKIENVPAGAYKLQAWHEKLGLLTQNIKVPKSGNVNVTFSFASK